MSSFHFRETLDVVSANIPVSVALQSCSSNPVQPQQSPPEQVDATNSKNCLSGSLNAFQHGIDNIDITKPSCSIDLASTKSDGVSGRRNKNWPLVFPIDFDKFHPSLQQALEKKTPLLPRHQRALIQSLYETILSYSIYPTPSQFKSVAVALLTMYPHLGNGLTQHDAESYWRYRLSHKLRNKRRTEVRDLPEVEHMRMKNQLYKANKCQGTLKRKRPLGFGCPNFLPTRDKSEDDASINAHIQFMKSEVMKEQPNHDAINTSLKCTFADRRRYIFTDLPSSENVKELYPCLFTPNQLLEEFRRITEVDLPAVITVFLKKYAKSIIRLTADGAMISADNDTAIAEMAMASLPKLMKETLPSSTEITLNSENEPLLVLEQEDGVMAGRVMTGNVVLCKTSGYFQGLSVLFASCFVLNSFYHKKHRNTLNFIQKVIVQIDSISKSPFLTGVLKSLNTERSILEHLNT
ncbi:uncharacterized protein LOC108675922 isoform X2 [Hyalella azteca]|uniref:Uncharacterized protein LOC108675922 isoform X2 n=1 Tax=Hyalella azteca TaxID=294128 RepID=A0A979FU02_HYAAZ|nr:uncharacterized protein LOC108675922 isoform X2 [Hyalella azteca]